MRRSRILAVVLALGLVAAACGTSDDTTTTGAQAATTTGAAEETTTTGAAEAGMKAGIGVDVENMVITLGALHDLTGPFSVLVIDINDAMATYYDVLNANGGIDGWTIDYIVEDTAYNVGQHLEKYEALRGEVLALTASTGSPTSINALDAMKADNMTFIPLSWYSGWAIPEFENGLGLELGTNYCIEAMNIMEFIRDNGGQTIALGTVDDDYGRDAAAGVKLAADFYGMDIVYDGEGAINRGVDNPEVITGIVGSGADWTFITSGPTDFAGILGGAFGAGYQGMWTGSGPSYLPVLLDTAVAPILDQVFYQSGYYHSWEHDSVRNSAMREAMVEAFPDRRPSDAFIIGWNEAVVMEQVLADAIASGDLTREGVAAAAAAQTGVDFQGTQPDQSYAGTPNEYVTRASAIWDPDLAVYTAAGGPEQTLTQEDGTTGSVLKQDFFVSEAAQDFEFSKPCYEF